LVCALALLEVPIVVLVLSTRIIYKLLRFYAWAMGYIYSIGLHAGISVLVLTTNKLHRFYA